LLLLLGIDNIYDFVAGSLGFGPRGSTTMSGEFYRTMRGRCVVARARDVETICALGKHYANHL
jgi:hypothetical protein